MTAKTERKQRDWSMRLRLSGALKRRIRELAERERRSMNAQVEILLERAVSENEAGR